MPAARIGPWPSSACRLRCRALAPPSPCSLAARLRVSVSPPSPHLRVPCLSSPRLAPLVAADHLEPHVQRLRVDADALDGARARRACRGGSARPRTPGRWGWTPSRAAAVAQQDLAVRPHIHDEPDLVRRRLVRLLGQDHGHVVRADVARLQRQDVRLRARRQPQPQIPRFDVHRIADRRRQGRLPQFARRDVEQDVVHHAVAHQHDVGDRVGGDAGLLGSLVGQFVQRVDDRVVQGRQPVRRVVVAIADPAHQVFAVGHLRVHAAGRGQHRARPQIAQMHGDGGRADVHGQAVSFFGVAGLHAHRLAALPDGDGDLPITLAHDILQLAQQHRVQPHVVEPEARRQLGRDAVPVAQLMLQRGLGRPPRNTGEWPDRPRWRARWPPCAPPACAPGSPPARRSASRPALRTRRPAGGPADAGVSRNSAPRGRRPCSGDRARR